jgi:hypothetical protein
MGVLFSLVAGGRGGGRIEIGSEEDGTALIYPFLKMYRISHHRVVFQMSARLSFLSISLLVRFLVLIQVSINNGLRQKPAASPLLCHQKLPWQVVISKNHGQGKKLASPRPIGVVEHYSQTIP